MKKKWLKIGAFVLALGLLLGIGWFANSLMGNPVSEHLARKTAEDYLGEVYYEKDFYIESINYSFKDGNYYAHVESSTSEDSSFTLSMDGFGALLWDSYESRVLLGQNTSDRLYKEYRALTDAVFEGPFYPFTSFIAYGELEFITKAYIQKGEIISEHAIVTEELELDKEYDIRELGAKAGHLVVYVEDDTVTVERAAEVLLELKYLMDTSGVPFYCIEFVLEYPRLEEGGTSKEGRVETMDFLYADIYEEGMVERVRVANEEAMAYHAEQDAIMQKQLEEIEKNEKQN